MKLNNRKDKTGEKVKKTIVSSNKRIFFTLTVLVFLFILIAVRLLYIQAFESEELTKAALRQLTKQESIQSNRGLIYDRNKKVMALNVSKSTIYYDSSLIIPRGGKNKGKRESDQQYEDRMAKFNIDRKKTLEEDATSLANILNLNREDLLLQISQDKMVRIARDVDRKVALKIRELNNPRISNEDYIKRFYPFGKSAAHVLGFLNNENFGIYGLESYYDDELSGIAGKSIKIKSEQQQQIPMTKEENYAPKNGFNLVSSIDVNIQNFADEAAQKAYNLYEPDKVSIIVQDTKTAQILAMVNLDEYDPNEPRNPINKRQEEEWKGLKDSDKVDLWAENWKNFSVESQYEPGSTFKLITAAAAIEEATTNPSKVYTCPGVLTDMKGVKISCTSKNRGPRTFLEAMEESCNIALVKVGRELGPERFLKYIRAFGFGDKTGIDLKGEVNGTIPKDPKHISKVSISTMSYGHGIAVTPIQLINAVSAIGNGGFLNEPRIIKEVVDNDGNIIEKFKTNTLRRVISQETSKTLKDIMEKVVEEGTGKKAKVPGYKIGGKTGTAYIASAEGYEDEYNSSFIGLAPAMDPQITVLVLINRPKGDFYGSTVAAPIAQEVMAKSLEYLKVPKTEKVDENALKEDIEVPDVTNRLVIDAGKILVDAGLRFNTPNKNTKDSSVVISQNPKAGSIVKNGTIIDVELNDPDEEKIMPLMTGMKDQQAESILKALNIEYNIVGNGSIVSQKPLPGTRLTEESKILLKCDNLTNYDENKSEDENSFEEKNSHKENGKNNNENNNKKNRWKRDK